MNEYTEHIETPDTEITDESIQDFIDRGGEAPTFHPVLRVWREVLSNAEAERTAKVTPQWANRIISTYRGLDFSDMEDFRDLLFGRILDMLAALDEEIATDDECLTYTTPEEDVEHNSGHYKAMISIWQKIYLGWELDWETTSPTAALEIAALGELHRMFFASDGITAYLDNIRFQYTEADQAELLAELEAMKEGR